MAIKITPGNIVSDGHVVLMPPGVTGDVTVEDGTTYNLGGAAVTAIEVDSHDHAKEVALAVSQIAAEDDGVPEVAEHDEAQSRKNLGLTKKRG